LKGADHVAEEADSNHFYSHLEDVLDLGEASDVPIANRRKRCNDPVNRRNVEVVEVASSVFRQYSTLDVVHDPAIFVEAVLALANEYPDVGEEVSDANDFENEPNHTLDLFQLLIVHEIGGQVFNELIYVALVYSNLSEFQIPDEY